MSDITPVLLTVIPFVFGVLVTYLIKSGKWEALKDDYSDVTLLVTKLSAGLKETTDLFNIIKTSIQDDKITEEETKNILVEAEEALAAYYELYEIAQKLLGSPE